MSILGKIGARLLGWFLLVALIPLVFMGFQGYHFAKKAVQHEVFLHMESVATHKMMRIDQWFRERISDIRLLSANPNIVRNCTALIENQTPPQIHDLQLILTHYKEQSESYNLMCIYDLNASLLGSTDEERQLFDDINDLSIFKNALESQLPVMSPIFAHKDIGASMLLANVIRDPSGDPIGMVVALLALSHTLDPIILDTTGLGQTGQAYLVDTAKVMLTPSRFMDHPEPLTHTMDTEAIRKALKGAGGSGVYRGYDGQQVMGAWVFMPDQRWALIVEMDAAEAFAPLVILRRNTIMVAVIVFIVILMVVVFMSRSISRPIRKLADASLQVSKGDLNTSVVVHLRDELGVLADRFNLMVRSMKESQESLQSAYEKLIRTQRALVQSEKLAAVGQTVASVVHEIRNPLSSIKMNLSILESKCEKDTRVSEHFQLAKSQTERLESMLSDLLNYSKPITLELNPITVSEIVNRAVEEVDIKALDLRIDINLDDPDRIIRVDEKKIHQVLLNVILNAAQALSPSGIIKISSKDIDLEGMPALQLSIVDNGKGVSGEHLDKVFEPFFTTKKQGTGLGLPNAKKIIEAHGGDMTIQSQIDQGTEVIIFIMMGA